jgi:hypothetical protein
MTLLKEKMQAAGVDTAAMRLAALAITALQECDGSIAAATEALFRKLSAEPWVTKEALLKPYLTERQVDMRGPAQHQPSQAPVAAPHGERSRPDPHRRRAVAQIVHKAVEAIRFKHFTSDGRDWATVGAHELNGMGRDGKLAGAIEARLGALSNIQKFKPLGELISRTIFNEVRASLEARST